MSATIHEPQVAGQFYSDRPGELKQQLADAYLSGLGPGEMPVVEVEGPRALKGLVSPHAGYMYSGATAAHGYRALAQDGRPATIVLIGPSHALRGITAATQTEGAWRTPLGDTPLDTPVAAALSEALPDLVDDERAFQHEHSLEVQLPFLQQLYGAHLKFVPIMMVDQGAEAAQRLGEAVAQALRNRDGVVIASSDMTHQQPPRLAREQDLHLAGLIQDLDPAGLLEDRERYGITMCGFGPVAAMLWASLALGATEAEVLAYHHSGEVMPMDRVVGYLSAVVR
jgi:AmmeMemoRadiSam system protein B